MNEQWKHLRLGDVHLSNLGNGFLGGNLVELDGFELTFIKGDEGSGHGFHHHDDLDEILIFLGGECTFNISGTDINIEGGSMLFVPRGMDHKVKYKTKSSVLRIKVSKPKNSSENR